MWSVCRTCFVQLRLMRTVRRYSRLAKDATDLLHMFCLLLAWLLQLLIFRNDGLWHITCAVGLNLCCKTIWRHIEVWRSPTSSMWCPALADSQRQCKYRDRTSDVQGSEWIGFVRTYRTCSFLCRWFRRYDETGYLAIPFREKLAAVATALALQAQHCGTLYSLSSFIAHRCQFW